jgi:MFS family permease
VSQWGDIVQTVSLALLVYELTESGFGVAAEIAPVLLVAPLAGALVDRLPRVRVMVVSDLARAGLVGLLAVIQDSLVLVLVVAFLTSVGSAFFNPSAGSVLPTLVRSDALVAANSGIWTAAVLSQIALAPLAGLVVLSSGFAVGFVLNAVSYVVSALFLRGLRVPAPPARLERRHLLTDAAEGARLLLGDRLLRALGVAQLLAALSAGATSALLVVYASEGLGVSGAGYGALLPAIGVGAALGPLVLLRLIPDPRRRTFVFGPSALRGVVDMVLAATTRLPVAAAALVSYGVATSTGAVTFTSLLQAETPDAMRGRVFASMDLLWQTGRLASLRPRRRARGDRRDPGGVRPRGRVAAPRGRLGRDQQQAAAPRALNAAAGTGAQSRPGVGRDGGHAGGVEAGEVGGEPACTPGPGGGSPRSAHERTAGSRSPKSVTNVTRLRAPCRRQPVDDHGVGRMAVSDCEWRQQPGLPATGTWPRRQWAPAPDAPAQ